MAGQRFEIKMYLTTDCKETVTSEQVEQWASEIFQGCDMGMITLIMANEHKTCPECKGQSKLVNLQQCSMYACPSCQGKGKITVE